MIREKHTKPFAISIYAAIVVALLLGAWDLVSSELAPLKALSTGGSKSAFLLLQQGVFLFLTLLYGAIFGSVAAALHSFYSIDDGFGRFRKKLQEKRFDSNLASIMLSVGFALIGFFLSFRAVLGTKDPDFFDKPVAGSYFGVLTIILIVVWALLSLSLFRGFRAVLRPIREKIGFSFSTLMLGLGVLGSIGVFGLLLLKVRGDENLLNVVRLPLLLAATAILHLLLFIGLFLLRKLKAVKLLTAPWFRLPVYALCGAIVLYAMIRMDSHPRAKAAMAQKSVYQLEVVRFVQSIIDLDRDGAAFVFGGPDCNDLDKKIGPHAEDIPGNGIDEDCRGGDKQKRPPRKLVKVKPKPTPIKKVSSRPKLVPKKKNGTVVKKKPTPATKPTKKASAPKRPQKPNIIFLLIDTVRADHVGFYGYKRNTTPELDKLAKRSIVFKNTYAPSNNTPKSVPAIFTSRYPSEVKWKRKYRNFPKVLDENLMFPEVLQKNGYTTVGLTAHWYFNKRKRNFQQGFEHWDNKGERTIKLSNTQISSPLITKKVAEWLPKLAQAKKPFFMFAHYFDPHSRYMVHRSVERFGKKLMDKYDNEIRFTDKYLGQVIALCEKLGLMKNTVIIVTSDHGEAFNEHKFHFHGQTLYNEVLKVPLVIYVPGMKHQVVDTDIGLMDLYPTVIELAGLPKVPLRRGHSLVHLFSNPKAPHNYPIYAELVRYPNWKEDIKAMIRDRMKLIYHMTRKTWELYDLNKDPGEQKNLFFDHPKAKSYKAQLLKWMDYELGQLD